MKLVLVGSTPAQCTAQMDSLVRDDPTIIRRGYVDDQDLPAVYAGAEMVVYASIYEGFGLPVSRRWRVARQSCARTTPRCRRWPARRRFWSIRWTWMTLRQAWIGGCRNPRCEIFCASRELLGADVQLGPGRERDLAGAGTSEIRQMTA